jgi:hypothetical protein
MTGIAACRSDIVVEIDTRDKSAAGKPNRPQAPAGAFGIQCRDGHSQESRHFAHREGAALAKRYFGNSAVRHIKWPPTVLENIQRSFIRRIKS